MNIQAVEKSATSYSTYTTTQNNKGTFGNVWMDAKENIDIERESATGGDVSAQLASQYDVRNATLEDLKEIAHALYEAGEISLRDVATLTFDYGKATNDVKQSAQNMYVSPDFNLYETQENQNGQRDWIAEFEARASKSFQYGDLVGVENNKKMLHILQKLQQNEPQVVQHFDDVKKSEIKVEEAREIAAQQSVESSRQPQSVSTEDALQVVRDYYQSLSVKDRAILFSAVAIQRIKANAYKNHNGDWKIRDKSDPNYVDIYKLPGFTYAKLADAMLDDLEFQRKFISDYEYKKELEVLSKFKQAVSEI